MLLVSPNFFSKLCSFLKIVLGLVKVCSLKKKTTKQVQIIIIYHISSSSHISLPVLTCNACLFESDNVFLE